MGTTLSSYSQSGILQAEFSVNSNAEYNQQQNDPEPIIRQNKRQKKKFSLENLRSTNNTENFFKIFSDEVGEESVGEITPNKNNVDPRGVSFKHRALRRNVTYIFEDATDDVQNNHNNNENAQYPELDGPIEPS